MKNKLMSNKISHADAPSVAPYRPSKEEQERQRRYAAEDALRTLQRAEECRRDPQLMRDVKQVAKQQMAVLKNVTGKR